MISCCGGIAPPHRTPVAHRKLAIVSSRPNATSPASYSLTGLALSQHPATRMPTTRRTRRHANQPGLLAKKYNSTSQARIAKHIRGLLWERDAPTLQPRRMRDASGLGSRSAGNFEAGLFDLDNEIAGEAALDAQRALDPLRGLGDDVLVEPLAGGLVQWPD